MSQIEGSRMPCEGNGHVRYKRATQWAVEQLLEVGESEMDVLKKICEVAINMHHAESKMKSC